MNIKYVFACSWLLAATSLQAAVLTATTAVHTKPDIEAPVITYLKAGSTATPTADSLATSPAEWMAIELSGPFEAYVQNKEIGKSLDVRPGATLHLLPKPDSGVLATMEAGDKMEITGLRGKWTQIKLTKKITGYIHVTGSSAATAGTYPSQAPVPAQASAPAPVQQSPVQPSAYGVGSAGQPAPMVNLGDGGSSTLPRAFQGKFVSTRRPFAPRRPYDYQINDDAGVRFAYLDLSKLLLTEDVTNYIDRTVAVFGAARNIPGTKNIVIEVESLQLK
ncbi:MAG: SH3 domain-containing protein [Opitutaceae bacterium]